MRTFIILGGVGLVLLVGSTFLSSIRQDGPIPGTDLVSSDGLHWHSEVSLFVNDEPYPIPPNIGLIGGHNPIHTHDADGVVHLEFERAVYKDDLRLGRLFEIWDKEFSSAQLLEHEGSVQMFVNGEVNTEFENYLLQDGDKIEIRI